MPRTPLASFEIERLEVLAADGTVDEELVPDLSDEELLELYRLMSWSRRVDEKLVSLQRRGEIGTHAPAVGQEAAQVGSAFALEADDWMVPSFREHPAFLTRGTPVESVLAYTAGMEEGAEIPEENRDLPPSIAVGSQLPHAAGIGWAQEIAGDDAATLGYFGDGASSQGDAYEGMNFAGVFDAHTVFFCQNNQYAISTRRNRQTRAETFAQKAIAAGIDAIQVDGNDVLGVYAATKEALEAAREGSPSLIEATTYRQSMHTTADDPSVYREKEEEDEWAERDPIERFDAYLRRRDVLTDELASELEEAVEAEIETAVERMRAQMESLDPADMFRHVFAEMPPELADQLAAFEEGRDGE